jgi:hypothetical protein
MYEQIVLLDREILPYFGFRGITDYQTILTVSILEQKLEFLDHLNQLLEKITTVFPTKKFNLHKTDQQVTSLTQAFNLLVHCLEISEVPHVVWTELHQRKTIKYLRLSGENIVLTQYIGKIAEKMSSFDDTNIPSGSKKERATMTEEDLSSMVRETHEKFFIIPMRSARFITEKQNMGTVAGLSLTVPFNHGILQDKCLWRLDCHLVGPNDEDNSTVFQQFYGKMSYILNIANCRYEQPFQPNHVFWDQETILPAPHPVFSNYTYNELLIKYNGNPHDILNLRLKFRLVIAYFGQKNWERICNANLMLKIDNNTTLQAHQINGCMLYKNNQQSTCATPDPEWMIQNDRELQSIDWSRIQDDPETNKKYITAVCNKTHDPLKYLPFVTQFTSPKQLKCAHCSRHVRYDSLLSLLVMQLPQLDMIGQQYNEQISPGSAHVTDDILLQWSIEDADSRDYPYHCYIDDQKCIIYYRIPQHWDSITNLRIIGSIDVMKQAELSIVSKNIAIEHAISSTERDGEVLMLQNHRHLVVAGRQHELVIQLPKTIQSLPHFRLMFDGYFWNQRPFKAQDDIMTI